LSLLRLGCHADIRTLVKYSCAGSRLLVQDTVYDKFVELLKERVTYHKVGDPFDKDVCHFHFYLPPPHEQHSLTSIHKTMQGPVASKTQYDRVLNFIKEGKDSGATASRALHSFPPARVC
jgi:aldehyde dehydrogenase (NAD+)